MKRIYNLFDLERRVYGKWSDDGTTGRRKGLRRVLQILNGGEGVGEGEPYEWSDPAEFALLVATIRTLRKSLC